MRIAFAGNPNSGKTTMYNALTGRNERVGNWAGVTVERKESPIRKGYYEGTEELIAVDLPGAYSMSPFTSEESITSGYVKNENPDVIINIVDATNLSRSLFFTTQLLELGIPVLQPVKVRKDAEFLQQMQQIAPDLIAVAAYGQILPKEILELPEYGCLNVHGSLLPRFRGAAPIQRAIIEGDEETGITIMYMEEGLDTGDMLAKAATPVGRKTGQELHDELAQMGAELLVDTLDRLRGTSEVKQDDALSTYAPMISKKRGHLDFSQMPVRLERTDYGLFRSGGRVTFGYRGDR